MLLLLIKTMVLLIVVLGVVYMMTLLRKVVPTNMVHIVQSNRKTTSYGSSAHSWKVSRRQTRGKPFSTDLCVWKTRL